MTKLEPDVPRSDSDVLPRIQHIEQPPIQIFAREIIDRKSSAIGPSPAAAGIVRPRSALSSLASRFVPVRGARFARRQKTAR